MRDNILCLFSVASLWVANFAVMKLGFSFNRICDFASGAKSTTACKIVDVFDLLLGPFAVVVKVVAIVLVTVLHFAVWLAENAL